jgi:hypothetical protein
MRGSSRCPGGHAVVSTAAAVDALLTVDTDHAAASGTRPPLPLERDEAIEPDFLDAQQVLHHAHAVLRSVALVESTQPRAREPRALEAEARLARLHRLAVLDQALDARSRLAGVVAGAAFTYTLRPKVPAAQTTVHPAGRDRRGNERFRVRRLPELHGSSPPDRTGCAAVGAPVSAALLYARNSPPSAAVALRTTFSCAADTSSSVSVRSGSRYVSENARLFLPASTPLPR